jgi:DNA-directed RNA polymerase subunit RPC12/RpoP
MPIVLLKVTRAAPEAGEHRPPEIVNPLFRGSGDTDYQCGNCGAVIASSMGPTQRVNVDVATCSACGAENEFPLNLQG